MLERWIEAGRRDKLATIEIALLVSAGIGLRFLNLGYSDFQGDEISAICHPSHFSSLIKFLGYLLGQQKGPVQYLITCAYGLVDPAFSGELLLRLPFAAANVLSLVCLFFIIRSLFDFNSAIFGTFLVAANGMFIAFGRIVQYQSFVILGVSASLLFLMLAIKRDRWRLPGLYLGFASAAGALLAHFDAVFIIPPLAVLTAYWWQYARQQPEARRLTLHLLGAIAVASLPPLAFYAEFAHHASQSSLQYWSNRIAGPHTNPFMTAAFYAPVLFVWVSLAAAVAGLLRVRWNLGWQVLLAWLIPPLAFFGLFFGDSRTHIYAYVLPLTLVAGLGLAEVTAWVKRRWGTSAGQAMRAVILIFLVLDSYASYTLFVDHSVEYPWQPKTVMGIEMPGGESGGHFWLSLRPARAHYQSMVRSPA